MNKKTIRVLFDELLGKYENAQDTVDREYSSHTEVELEQMIEEWRRRINEALDG